MLKEIIYAEEEWNEQTVNGKNLNNWANIFFFSSLKYMWLKDFNIGHNYKTCGL